MAERDQMLTALVREVLGPRKGPNEILPEELDPRNEYITGVLEPVSSASTIDEREEDDIEEVIEETSSEEDQDTQGYVASPGVFSPALDPKALPRSIGLSFTLEAESSPQIEICATWARYYLEHDGWHRHPAGYLSGVLDVSRPQIDREAAPGVRLHIRSRQLIPDVWRISVFFINNTQIVGERPTTGEYIFQPQMRVHVSAGSRIIPVRHLDETVEQKLEDQSEIQEDMSLALLYRNRTAFARGHMCGAMWKEIDPERSFSVPERPLEAPFVWTDLNVIDGSERNKFTPADVRTEMIPIYLVQTPEMGWLTEFGPAPELNPVILSEAWEPDALRNALQPLVNGYRAWIQGQQALISQIEPVYQNVAQVHILECNQVAERIQEAIEILCTDEDVRLAFCFANKAIDMQSRWKNSSSPLIWRPFQLAFLLLNIPSLANPNHPDRNVCDLLWFPTGGGKTEAYLGLSAFVLGLRRLRAKKHEPGQDCTGAGVGVLSRYTLRLLTIQQFRRALGVITACELLRVMGAGNGNRTGWHPRGCIRTDNYLWGGIRFSAGLWVGGGVTPNALMSIGPMPIPPNGPGFMMIAGALDILRGLKPGYTGPDNVLAGFVQQVHGNLSVEGEPAQVTQCPCCHSHLAISNEGLGSGVHTLHFVYRGGNDTSPQPNLLTPRPPAPILVINSVYVFQHETPGYRTVSINFTVPDRTRFTADNVDEWWEHTIKPALGTNVEIQSARPARPGYFLLSYSTNQRNTKENDFDIYCPNPDCELNHSLWAEQVPEPRGKEGVQARVVRNASPSHATPRPRVPNPVVVLAEALNWQDVPEPFRLEHSKKWSTRIPIPAVTVDDQIYHRCPSIVIATVDKFARLAFEPKAASIFGNVTHYHSRWGYYRWGCPPNEGTQQAKDHPSGMAVGNPLHRDVQPFLPPDLILQDELHLIEGPLGSMVGMYEMAIDLLCQRTENGQMIKPKYIASTATVRQAKAQVLALFDRRLSQFPPSAISADERFFATGGEAHPLDTSRPGRLYAAICAPGKGAQTPIIRIWSALLQESFDLSRAVAQRAVDPFWTLVGYFNATRELAGALSLYRQDIPERLESRAGINARPLDETNRLELSSRASSMNLPGLLQKLELPVPGAMDGVFATSMFGTGVDVDRLSLMVVHGQPKTTSSYIQATGRVGRQVCGLIVAFFRASRPRDLDHYEFFTGYHRALYRYVEPITVAPFSPRARERSLGPLAVILLRQARRINDFPVNDQWRIQQRDGRLFVSRANRMATSRFDPEVIAIPDLFEQRALGQPEGRRPAPGSTLSETISELDRWRILASKYTNPDLFVYNEAAVFRPPQRHVVLGDAQHRGRFNEAFENAPQSLREVEETTGFKV